MSTRYSRVELVDLAKQIEACGEAFYAAAVDHVKSEKLRELFTWLRDEEARHARVFERLLLGLEERAGEWRHDDDYLAYMRTLAASRVFPDAAAAREAVAGLVDEIDAVGYAIGFEKEAILFLHELRPAVAPEAHDLIDELIAEERRHVQRLSGMLPAP